MTREKMWTTRREAMALLSGAVAGVALGGDARAQGTPKRGGTLRISAPTNPSSLDPATGGAGSDHAFLFTMYDTLTEWDFETLKSKPGLAESWSFSRSDDLRPQHPSGCDVSRRHAARCGGRQIQPGAQQVRSEIQHQGRPRDHGVRCRHRSDAGDAEAEHARRRIARHPQRSRRHDGVADRAQGQCRAATSRARRSAPAPMPLSAGRTARRSSSSATRNTGSRTGHIPMVSSSRSFPN